MADKDKKEKEVEEKEAKEETGEFEVEVEYSDIANPFHPTMQSIGRFCNLYIGIEENFQLLELNDAMLEKQKKFEAIKAKLYKEVYDRPIPQSVHALPDEDDQKKMTTEEKEEKKRLDKEYGKKLTEAQKVKVKLSYPEIRISKEALEEAMEREKKKVEAGKDAIFISPNDIAILRQFVTFI